MGAVREVKVRYRWCHACIIRVNTRCMLVLAGSDALATGVWMKGIARVLWPSRNPND